MAQMSTATVTLVFKSRKSDSGAIYLRDPAFKNSELKSVDKLEIPKSTIFTSLLRENIKSKLIHSLTFF